MDKIKNCPFCDGVADTGMDDDGDYYVSCQDCNSSIEWENKEECAIKTWNTRHISKQDLFENIPKCGACKNRQEDGFCKSMHGYVIKYKFCYNHTFFDEARDE